MASTKLAARDWADDDDFEDPTSLPKDSTTVNKDGTKTIITYSLNESGQRVKTTRRIRTTVVRETVNPRVAERRTWSKFGKEAGHSVGPQSDTTSVGENILFKPSVTWRKDGKDEIKKEEEESVQDQLRNKKVRCRICEGEHFTARCPFKETMAPAGEEGAGADGEGAGATVAGLEDDLGPGKLGTGSGGYVPPHMRKGGSAAAGAGERMGGGKFERDDLATLRVTNVSEFAEEQDLREMFERFGRVTRVFLAKDRETGRAKGFAFISYADRVDAERACDKMDGYGYGHLILRVEFAKRAAT